jgi:pimeloyl-ACP methyl ester carboxylesterase
MIPLAPEDIEHQRNDRLMPQIDRRTFTIAVAAMAAASLLPAAARSATVPIAKNVVLVHGLFADGSCWSEVIARLQAAGLNATAVQNPLTTLPEAVASAQRVLVRQDGPTVLVGHSFSGMIVTEAGMHPNVSALVYVGLLNKSIFQPEGGRSGMIRGDFTCRKADAV